LPRAACWLRFAAVGHRRPHRRRARSDPADLLLAIYEHLVIYWDRTLALIGVLNVDPRWPIC